MAVVIKSLIPIALKRTVLFWVLQMYILLCMLMAIVFQMEMGIFIQDLVIIITNNFVLGGMSNAR